MDASLDDVLAFGILVALIDVLELVPAIAAIEMIANNKISRIQESQSLLKKAKHLESNQRLNCINFASTLCQIYGYWNQEKNRCLNPANPPDRK